jgi:hypothetical protein
MSNWTQLLRVGVAVAAAAGVACKANDPSPIPVDRRVITLTAAETQAAEAFETRVKDYLGMREKLVAGLPKLPKQATPEQVDKNQRVLGELVRAERTQAQRADFFSPGVEGLVRRTLKAVLAGPGGKTIEDSIMDENPGVPNLKVNDRYPDSVPLSTMPPQVLEPLPKLAEDLEYRFIGKRLVLLDAQAHIILDFTNDVLP